MTPLDRTAARREVEHLHRLAMDALEEGQYATMERLLESAVETAERLDDLPLLVKERSWLADARRMLGRHTQAISTYTWLIGLAIDPNQSRGLADEVTLQYLARAFANFLDCGYWLPELPVEQLLSVASDGLSWLDRVGKPHWAADLRAQRGDLNRLRGDTDAARRDLEAALARKRRHPDAPGYPLASHRLALAELLSDDLKVYAEAAELLEEVLNDPTTKSWELCRAFRQLAPLRQAQGNLVAAEEAARAALGIARQMESSFSMACAYEALGRVQQDADQLDAATQTFAQEWHWSRLDGGIQRLEMVLLDCARLRLEQARRACRMTKGETRPPDRLPAGADRALAARRLRSARRFLGRARPLAEQRDRATDRRRFQDEADGVARRVDELFACLEDDAAERKGRAGSDPP
jgi:tetratricopeptide (TPR) repeat protein